VKDAGEVLVATDTGVENSCGRHANREQTRVHDLKPVRIGFDKDVAALGIWTVHERIYDQLADDRRVIHWHLVAAFLEATRGERTAPMSLPELKAVTETTLA
jgi:hypothetical protein